MRVLLTVLVVLSPLPLFTASASGKEQERVHPVTLKVDSLLRSDSNPDGFLPLSRQAPPLEPDKYYFVVFITFTRIPEVFVQSLGGRDAEKSVLLDASGGIHPLSSYQTTGIRFLDSSDIRSPSWIVEGGTATLFFQLPRGSEPESLVLKYYFKEALEDQASSMGEVEIPLTGARR